MDVYGLLGKKLSHSFSPDYFNEKFKKLGVNAKYKIFELDNIEDFPQLITDNPNLVGLNVTVPYKRSLAEYLDITSRTVQFTGSVNTIRIKRTYRKTVLYGYNTDVIGFEETIKPILKKNKNISALILGTGGSAKSVAFVLRKLGILFYFVSRNINKTLQTNYNNLDRVAINESLLIINTTPVGMLPKVDESPDIPYHFLSNKHILFDLVYNPSETLFMKKGKENGATCYNGLDMLKIQADASWKIWNK